MVCLLRVIADALVTGYYMTSQ